MTLALYGKSRKRQGGLMAAGMLAIVVAMLLGFATMGRESASAVTAGYFSPTGAGSGDCSGISNSNVVGGTFTTCANGQTATYSGFGFAIPAGSTIDGIEVSFAHSTSNADSNDAFQVRVSNGGFSDFISEGTAQNTTPPTHTDTPGGSSELWGLTWTAAQANAIQVSFTANSIDDTMFLDNVQVRIFYTAPVIGGQFAVYTSIQNITPTSTCENGGGSGVNCNQYNAKTSVFLNGGPSTSFLPDSWYCFSVYDSSGKDLLSTDLSIQRTFEVAGGEILYSGNHAKGLDSRTVDAEVTIGFAPFNDSDNGIYKYALYQYPSQPDGSATECAAGAAVTKTDNFSVAATAPPAAPSVTVTKVDSGDGTYAPNESFSWTITATVANGPTVANYAIWDNIPAGFTVNSVTETDAAITCTAALDPVDCTLLSGAATGAHTITVNVTVAANAVCEPVVNTVRNGTSDTAAPVATDTVTIVDCVITPAPTPSITIAKADDGDGTYILGEDFHWVIIATVSGGPTTGATTITDTIPSPVVIRVDALDPWDLDNGTGASGFWSCGDQVGPDISCTIASGAPVGTYIVEIPVEVPSNAPSNVCATYTNTATIVGPNVTGTPVAGTPNFTASASDAITVTGCGTVSILKSDGVKNGANVEWTITLTNTSAVTQNVFVYDQNTSLVSETCVGSVTESPADYYNCSVPALGSATLVLSTAIPAYNVCAGIEISNQALLVSTNTSGTPPAQIAVLGQDGGGINIAAVADASCITVTKADGVLIDSNPDYVLWNITFTNSGPAAPTQVDSSDTYQPGTTGTTIVGFDFFATCDVVGQTTIQGCDLAINASNVNGGTTLAQVRTGAPADSCQAQTVSNTIGAVFNGTPIAVTPGGQLTATYVHPAHPELCNRTITITKNYVGLNGYVPLAADLPAFTLTPDPFDGIGDYIVVDDASCNFADGNPDVWTCTVPADWNGSITETPPVNWQQVTCAFALVREVAAFVQSILPLQALQSQWEFCNRPLGSIEVIKIDNVSAANPGAPADNDWDFTVTGPNAFSESDDIARLLNNGSFTLTGVPLANGYNAVEDDARVGLCPTDSNPSGEGYETFVVAGGPQNLTAPGQKLTFIFRNEDCGAVLGTGQLQVFKVRDINGNGIKDGADTNIAWTVTVTGPQFPGGQQFNVPAAGLFLDGIDEGLYTVQETLGTGYVVVGVETNDNASVFVGGASSTSVNLTNNDIDSVTFFNQPLGEIRVQKVAYTRHNNNADVLAPNDDDGWIITVSSVACAFNESKPTDANGQAVFTNLELCSDYVVSENPVNAGSPGFQPGGPIQLSNQTPGPIANPLVVTFVNRLQTFDPPCANCNPGTTPTPTATPVTPTPTPGTATPTLGTPTATPTGPAATPTNTQAPTTPTNTAVPSLTNIAGERTPGPGQTPIAPSTGDGLMGSAGGGINLLLILGGLIALSSGLGFLALGRKRS